MGLNRRKRNASSKSIESLPSESESQPSLSSPSTTKLMTEAEREEIYSRLINEAPYIPGDYETPIIASNISWYNHQRVTKGQEFVKRNFFSIILAHVGALLYGFAFKRLSTVLLRTGHSDSVSESVVRYLSTFSHFKTWYEADIRQSCDVGYIDILKVRQLHRNALHKYNKSSLPKFKTLNSSVQDQNELVEAIQSDLKHIQISSIPLELRTWTPKVPMSQFDMVMTQFGLCSLVFLFPDSLGIEKNESADSVLDQEGLDGFFHLWALYGRLLGIMDKFNIALYPDRQLYRKIFLNIGIRSLKETDLTVMRLQKTFIDGLSSFTWFGSIKSYLYQGFTSKEALPEFEGTCMYSLMNWQDKLYYESLQFLIYIYQKVNWIRLTVNFLARVLLKFYFKTYSICPFGKRKASFSNGDDYDSTDYNNNSSSNNDGNNNVS